MIHFMTHCLFFSMLDTVLQINWSIIELKAQNINRRMQCRKKTVPSGLLSPLSADFAN